MLPPDSATLLGRIAARNARRAATLSRALPALAAGREERQAAAAFRSALGTLRGPARRDFLLLPPVRAWMTSAETAAALARSREGDRRLFERIAGGPLLGELLPRGRLDAGFRRRARRAGERMLRVAFRRIPALVAFRTARSARFGPFPLDAGADAEEAAGRGEVHLWLPTPAVLRVRPGARITLDGGGIRVAQSGPAAALRPRPCIPATGIALGRRLTATRRGLRVEGPAGEIGSRLAEALDLVERAWPEAWREILLHTREVVPLREAGVVSYSLPERPGTSYINVEGKSRVDLADDLLHEAAHHRLHSVEEVRPLHGDPEAAFYYSPWRRAMRPLHGILHSAYTFTFRAELLLRLRELPHRRLPRVWMRREASKEIRWLRAALEELRGAREEGLLTAAGSRLLTAMAREVGRLGRGG